MILEFEFGGEDLERMSSKVSQLLLYRQPHKKVEAWDVMHGVRLMRTARYIVRL